MKEIEQNEIINSIFNELRRTFKEDVDSYGKPKRIDHKIKEVRSKIIDLFKECELPQELVNSEILTDIDHVCSWYQGRDVDKCENVERWVEEQRYKITVNGKD